MNILILILKKAGIAKMVFIENDSFYNSMYFILTFGLSFHILVYTPLYLY